MSERHPDIYNEFDLEAARKAGQAFERERIIKLLEGLAYIDEQGHEMVSEFKSDLIALLQGEHCQDCEKRSCKPHYIGPKTYIIKGEQK